MIVTVRTIVEVTGAPEDQAYPTGLTWVYRRTFGDNPRFFADSVVLAIGGAAQQAAANVEVYRDLTDPVAHRTDGKAGGDVKHGA